MPAGRVKLVLDVERAQVGLLHEQVLLSEAQAADVQGGAVGGGLGDERPVDLVAPFQPLQIPHVLAQARVGSLPDVLEARSVVVPTRFPGWFGPAHVGLHLQDPWVLLHLVLQPCSLRRQGFDLCLVNDVFSQALAVQWAVWLVLRECLWRQPEKNSSLALRLASSGWCMRMYFSRRQRRQDFELALKGWQRARILHLMV